MKLPLFHYKKIKGRPHQQGFTLVELLVYMALLAIFVTMISEIFLSVLETKVESMATAAVNQDSTYVISKLAYDVAQANAITTPVTLGGSGSTLALLINGVTYTYSLSGGQLQVSSTNGTYALTSPETVITAVSFRRLGNSGGKETVRIEMTLESLTQRRSGKEVKTITTTVGRR